jgi:hypothetical protein
MRGILFKVAEDHQIHASPPQFLYGGSEASDEFAGKAASHELKGAVNYFRFHNDHPDPTFRVRVPMQVTLDYRGFRLVAMPLLPLHRLVYGSNDLGRTVHADTRAFNDFMKNCATKLHLAGHYVRDKELHSAGDVEGHEGKDGRYYLLDLARG